MEQLLILHGALGGSDQFDELIAHLPQFEIHTLDFRGHGARANHSEAYSLKGFKEDVLNYIEDNNLSNPYVFGYSMGGYVAICLEKQKPGTFSGIVTLGSKVEWSPEIATKEASKCNPEIIESKVPAFAKALEERHGDQWKSVLNRTAEFMRGLGEQNPIQDVVHADLKCGVTMLLAEDDNMVSKEETEALAQKIGAEFRIVEDSKHPIEQVDVSALADEINSALAATAE